MESKAHNVTRKQMQELGETDKKLAPIDIWNGSSRFGEGEIVYQLLSI